jgi:hypothetical protein
VVCLCPSLVIGQVVTFPAAPKQGETVRLQVPQGGLGADQTGHGDNYSPADTLVSMSNNTITVSLLTTGNNGFELQPSPPVDVPLGQFPAGTYQVEVTRRSSENGTAGPLGTTTFTVTARAPGSPLWNFSDLWWTPSESGWGLNLMQHSSGIIFATWFVYGQDGHPVWYHVPAGSWITPTRYQGTVYRTMGPYFGSSFNPAQVTVTPAGSATFDFNATDYDLATVTFNVDGVSTTKDVQRQSF